tara:strand:- start:329 stop:622 length:294 start_codon:yes stop_codon:yes gene_type:complete
MEEPYYQSNLLTLKEIINIIISSLKNRNIEINDPNIDIVEIIIHCIQEKLKNDKMEILTNKELQDENTKIEKFGSLRGFMTFIYDDLFNSVVKNIQK